MSINGRHDLSPLERLIIQIIVDGRGCWIWQGGRTNKNGHARFAVNGNKVLVHRYTFEKFVRPIPDGLVLDHLCRTPPCVNPSHLVPRTNAVNILIGEGPPAQNSRRSVCVKGHEFIVRYINLKGKRIIQRKCQECRNHWLTKQYLRNWLNSKTHRRRK